MKNDERRFETSLKMTSKVGIIACTIVGAALYLLGYLSLAFTSPKPMATWEFLVGGIGGAILVGVVIAASLRFGRYLLTKLFMENANSKIR